MILAFIPLTGIICAECNYITINLTPCHTSRLTTFTSPFALNTVHLHIPVLTSSPLSLQVAMANNRALVVALVLMGILAFSHVSEAASKKNCGKDPLGALMPCLKAVIGSKPPAPDAECCKVVRKANLDCLCDAFTSAKPPPGFKPNISAALALPKKCKRSIPKNYKCKGISFK
ncbi:hypothetical protein Mapa_001924 [Marchantia paleacea]|nr:hypothetical protein Mapa_001924 [Marchantia paleacea]